MTSIEWLKEKLFYDFGFAFSDNIYKQAKEMHKKEMEQLPQQEICINCDEEKETHEICMDCISKLIKENHKEISDEEIFKRDKK